MSSATAELDQGPLRTFLAADLDAPFLDEAAALAESLRAGPLSTANARWVDRATMHVTLRFYGATSAPQLTALHKSALGAVGVRAPEISVTVGGLGAFPRRERARVLFVALEDDGALAEIARAAEADAIALGFAPEPRAFRPHLTLARLREPADLRAVCAAPITLPPAHITGITLYESKTLPSGPVYTPIARVSRIDR